MRRFDQSDAEMKAALDDGSLGRALTMHNFHRNVENPSADFTADMAITDCFAVLGRQLRGHCRRGRAASLR